VVAAAYTTTRAVEDPRLRWPVATGALLGAAFLAKSLQAFLVLPAMAAVLLLAAPGPLRSRLGRLAAGGAALLISAGWWPLVVSLIPKADRPWVGGTTDDNPLGLAFGYNGLGRLAGQATPSGRESVNGGSVLRLLGSAADEVGWLLPAALLALVAGLVLVRRRPRTDPQRAALVLWGGWAVVAVAVFSLMRGIWHAYYTVELAPAIAGLVAVGATLLWRSRTAAAVTVLGVGSAISTAWAVALLSFRLGVGPAAGVAVAACGIAGIAGLAVHLRSPARRPAALLAVASLLAAAVLGPVVWSTVTVGGVHTGSGATAGPGHPAARLPISAQAVTLLRRDADDWTWSGAVVGHRAGDIQLAVGAPVMPVGGFAGSDPSPSLAQFEADVAAHKLHWFVRGGRYSGTAGAIESWVSSHAPVVRAGRTTLYDVGALAPSDGDDDRP
jgi:4-amino-4-deoxy-L-arabinose transferase-like glycosyltransferase